MDTESLETRLAVLETIVAERDKARSLQAKEYERRLESLNHEAAKLASMQATYLPREVWEGVAEDIRKDLASLQSHRDQMVGRMSVIAILVSLVIGLMFTALNAFVLILWS